jgi:uncharacterized protein (TIGR02284 family)
LREALRIKRLRLARMLSVKGNVVRVPSARGDPLFNRNARSIMNTDTSTLNDLIEVLNDSKSFYQEASAKVARQDLKSLFERMARTKNAIANDLKNKVVSTGEKPADGTMAGSLRKSYGELRAKVASDPEAQYVAQLEEFEDRIVKAFNDAVTESDDPEVRNIAQKYMPEINRDHTDMRNLKQIIKAH